MKTPRWVRERRRMISNYLRQPRRWVLPMNAAGLFEAGISAGRLMHIPETVSDEVIPRAARPARRKHIPLRGLPR